MSASVPTYFKINNEYYNCNQVSRFVVNNASGSDGTVNMYISGGDDYVTLTLGASPSAAVAALNGLLTPIDFSSYTTQ